MRAWMTKAWLAAALALAWPAATPAASSEPVTVFAAASLQESLEAVAAAWTARSGQRVVLSYAGSAALARQIGQGAPAHVFVSADRAWMDYAQQRNLIEPASRFDLAGNRLVLVAPADDAAPLDLAVPGAVAARLGADGRLSVAETDTVPAGRYARQALVATGQWPAVAGRLAQSDNVRTALQFVARGEAPLGVVYATDARSEPRVAVVARFEASTHAPIVYPAARVAGAESARAEAFLAFLRGGEAQAIFRRFGFSEP